MTFHFPDWARRTAALTVAAMITSGMATAQTPATGTPPSTTDIVGTWLDASGDGGIELKACGQGICGRIVWLKQPKDPQGRPMLDALNKDAAKRSTPLCNLQLIGGGTRRPDGGLERGWIYSPEDGARYDVDIVRIDQDRLKVHGYLGVKFLGETFTWRRAPASLGRCAAQSDFDQSQRRSAV